LSELALNSSTVPSRSVRIIGGSLGGLFAANLLYRAGWDVRVYERSPEELNGRGAGIVTHPELFEALQRCGVDVDDSIGVRVYSRVTLAQDGRVLARLPMEQVLTAWGRLFEVLRRALPRKCYVNGVSALGVTDAEEGVHLSLSDGRTERVDLVVAADGALLARVEGSQASSRIGSLQGADLLLEIPAELGSLEAGTELWAQLLRLPVF
jgi:2-polyprenyl-6-methoxyphenol hydroxylase-like FAD-dependent oxidoreductase